MNSTGSFQGIFGEGGLVADEAYRTQRVLRGESRFTVVERGICAGVHRRKVAYHTVAVNIAHWSACGV